jgi:imidazolonepropionase-like amidohydrolase
MPEGAPTIFAAGLALPVSAPAIREGAVLVSDGRIAAVGTLEELGQANPDAELRYFPTAPSSPAR